MNPARIVAASFFALAAWVAAAGPADAGGLSLTPAIVDLPPDQPPRSDLELLNDGAERLYVVVEPSQIVDPGTPSERRVQDVDPQKLGLLATPSRLVLEPGERKYVRVAMLVDPGAQDRIYRVTVKPVTGDVSAPATGLKILVGYDVLVIQRPAVPKALIAAKRVGMVLTMRNDGNTNAELFGGKQCDASGGNCTPVAGGRLYAGTSRDVTLRNDGPVEYSVKVGGTVSVEHY
jgi:P pilus assembly chaperone PapD